MKKKFREIEAEQFIHSTLTFISEQAERFHTSEEFIEDVLMLLITAIKKEREKECETK